MSANRGLYFSGLAALFFLAGGWLGYVLQTDDRVSQDSQTQEMVSRLAELDRRLIVGGTPYDARARVKALEARLTESVGDLERTALVGRLADAHLLNGQSGTALDLVQGMPELLADNAIYSSGVVARFLRLRALSYLRIAEQKNCLTSTSVDACTYPVRPDAVHIIRVPALMANEDYKRLSEGRYREAMDAWLAHLTSRLSGNRPVENENIIFAQKGNQSPASQPLFRNISTRAGVNNLGLAGGVVTSDLNGDGWVDIVASSWGSGDQIRVYLNDQRGGFIDWTMNSGLTGITGGLNMIHADYDNDGDNDILVLRGAWLGGQGRLPNSLLQNNGNGIFRDVTESVGLLEFVPTQTASWCDLNNDGWLDLVVGVEASVAVREKSQVYLADQQGGFVLQKEGGIDVLAFVKAVSCGDIDNDGDMDLYFSILAGPNRLFKNDSSAQEFRFSALEGAGNASLPKDGFPAWFWDMDNDGDLDIFAGAYSSDYRNLKGDAFLASWSGSATREEPSIWYENNNGVFSPLAPNQDMRRIYYPMGSNFADLDGNGLPDMYLGTGTPSLEALLPNAMLMNLGSGFSESNAQMGTGLLQKGHGVAMADFDHDGDLDIYTVTGGAFLGDLAQDALFQNLYDHQRWIVLEFEGRSANRSAIGTRVRIVQQPDGKVIESRVNTGGSFGSSDLVRTVALAADTTAVALEVWWPGGAQPQQVQLPKVNSSYHILQDGGAVERPYAAVKAD